jgi:hypothetical protein
MQSARWPVIVGGCAALGALAGFGISFLLPQVYISRASIAVRTPAGATAVEAVLPTLESAMSRRSLTDVLRAQDLYARDVLRRPLEDVIHTMRRNITVVARPESTSLEVSFAYEDRLKAQSTTALLVANIMEASLPVPERAPVPHVRLEVTTPPDLPESPVNRYFIQGTLAGLSAGLVLGSIIARARRHHALA